MICQPKLRRPYVGAVHYRQQVRWIGRRVSMTFPTPLTVHRAQRHGMATARLVATCLLRPLPLAKTGLGRYKAP